MCKEDEELIINKLMPELLEHGIITSYRTCFGFQFYSIEGFNRRDYYYPTIDAFYYVSNSSTNTLVPVLKTK